MVSEVKSDKKIGDVKVDVKKDEVKVDVKPEISKEQEMEIAVNKAVEERIKQAEEEKELAKVSAVYGPVKHIFPNTDGKRFIAFLLDKSVSANHFQWLEVTDMNLVCVDDKGEGSWDINAIWHNIRERSLKRNK
tara:strand:- start:16249 stop:16650 length:402 start_codon:yes stop_codon:yes gene_type:complete